MTSPSTPPTERTFAMADLAGSSRLWNRHPQQMAGALALHDEIAGQAVAGHGEIFKHTGDGFIAVFEQPDDAVRAMAGYLRSLDEHGPTDVELRSRVNAHRGPAEERGGDWFGPGVNHLARLNGLVAPTHLVVSEPVATEIGDVLVELESLGTFTVRDVPEPVELFAVRVPTSKGPPLTAAAGIGLPQFHSELVGRDDEVESVLALLERSRLVTVTGFGGAGKTRLAVEAATRWADRAGQSVHFADLTSSAQPDVTVAEAVGIPAGQLRSGTSSAVAVARHLGDQPALLVIDNCEHVIDAAADVCDDLLGAAPKLRLLATSREPLELDGEVVRLLSPLDGQAAVDLLHRRVAATGSPPVDDELAARLCAQVDHLPLGIELIAARLRQRDAEQLCDELAADLGALKARRRRSRSGDGGETGGRHSTMSALVAWSFDLLEPAERELLLLLSRLPAPWTPETAGIVAGAAASAADIADAADDLLAELVAKSLVVVAGAGRLRVLEPVRQFCAERLAAQPTTARDADDALVAWALELTREDQANEDPVFDAERARLLNEQAPNLRAGLAAARRRERAGDESTIALGLWPLLVDGRARSWFGAELHSVLDHATDRDQRLDLLLMAFHDLLTTPADAGREQQLLSLLEEVDPEGTSAASAVAQSNAALKQLVVDRVLELDPIPTRATLDRLAARAQADGRRLHAGIALLYGSFSHLLHLELEEASALADEAAATLRQINFHGIVALADATTALARGVEGGPGAARALEIIGDAVPLGAGSPWETSVRTTQAFLLAQAGQHPEAAAAADATVALALSHGEPAQLFDALIALAAVRLAVDPQGAKATLDLAGIGRTPPTIFLLFELAERLELDLGVDRFVDAIDVDANARRAAAARPTLEEAAGSTSP